MTNLHVLDRPVPDDAVDDMRRHIQNAQHILVISHANPDADSIASLLSFRSAFQREQNAITLYSGSGDIPETLAYLPGTEDIQQGEPIDVTNHDLVVFLDCADIERVTPGNAAFGNKVLSANIPSINIDHHITNTRFASINVIDAKAAATCEILALIYPELGVEITAELATILLSGIQGDTLGMKTPSTTSQTFQVAGDLVSAGADLDTIVDFMFRVKPYSTVKLWGAVLASVDRIGPLVWSQITPEMLKSSSARPSEGEGIVNFLAGTDDARAAALLHKHPDGWRVSLRSRTDDVDVSVLAALYGGGGHSRAAGCRVDGGDDARDQFLRDIASRL